VTNNPQSPRDGGSDLRVGTRTDIGLRRKRNEDFLDVRQTQLGLLMVVCDGMGGPGNGDRASRLAVEAFVTAAEGNPGDPGALLNDGVERAGRAIAEEIARDPSCAGMGTTLVAALVKGMHATVANVGDSRAYLYAGGSLRRVSRDHSLVGEMVARGELTEDEAARHPRRNIITRALGGERGVVPDLFELDLAQGDTLLLATDGLHGMISDASIAEVLAGGGEPSQLCDMLIERALAAGGDDNITVALLRLDAGGSFSDIPTDPGEEPRRRRGQGGMLAGIVAVLLLAAAWMLWLRPMSHRDAIPGPYDPDSDTGAVRTYDSSGWIDMQDPSPAPGRDSVHPGDLLEW
jgi:protein phosphatase